MVQWIPNSLANNRWRVPKSAKVMFKWYTLIMNKKVWEILGGELFTGLLGKE